jgi:transposase
MTSTNAVFVAIEMSKSTWLVAVYTPWDGRIGQHKVDGGDLAALLLIIERVRNKHARAVDSPVSVHCCFEAGYDGFWLARRLRAEKIEPYVIDPSSLKVDRRAKRAKTDRIDVGGLLRVIMAVHQGDLHACRLVPIPSPEQEDAKRTHRERQRLVKERTGHINRIKGLLATQGIYDYQPLKQDRRRLRGVGAETATILVREAFYRSFANCKALASYAGLTPSPYASGGMNRDQGLDHAGNSLLRKTMVELAWVWFRYQPDSTLSRWFRERVGEQKGRIRRIAVVALARKLLIALWRYATTGLVPTGAILKA